MLSSELYAISQGSKCQGPFECHWCTAPCTSEFTHDDYTPLPFQKWNALAKRPASQYLCKGCWLWRRKRITIDFLFGGIRDIQCPLNHSWFITPVGAWALEPKDSGTLYNLLLTPPPVFMLSLIVAGPTASGLLPKQGVMNHLQQAIVNEHSIPPDAGTPLAYTINGGKLSYTPEELEYCLRDKDANGRDPGVSSLVKLLGPHTLPPLPKKKQGRPGKEELEEQRALRRK